MQLKQLAGASHSSGVMECGQSHYSFSDLFRKSCSNKDFKESRHSHMSMT